MAELYSYEHIGVKSEVANTISMLEPETTMFLSTLGKKTAKNQKFEWQIDSLRAPSKNAWPENVKWSDIPKDYGPTIMLANYAQKFIVGLSVTSESQRQAYYAGKGQLSRQTNKRAIELKSDVEWAAFNNGQAVAPARDGDGNSIAAETCGVKCLISSTDGGETITGDPEKGIVTYFVSASTTPTEADIRLALRKLKEVGAKPEILMASMDMGDVISGMQESTPNRVRVFENSKTVTWEVNTITDAYGTTVKVMYNPMMPNGTVFIYNSDDWDENVFEPPSFEKPPKDGDADEVIMKVTCGFSHANPWKSAWIEGASTALTGVSLAMSVTTGVVGTAITSNATATPEPELATNVTYSYAMSALAGLTCNAATGKVTGTPTAAGTATITVTAAQGGVTKTGTATIVVSAS